MQYKKIKTDFDKPNFDLILLTNTNPKSYDGFTPDYYLFNESEIEEAYQRLKTEIARGVKSAKLYQCVEHINHTYRTKPIFGFDEITGKIIAYDNDADLNLHVNWWVHCGEWLNPRNDI